MPVIGISNTSQTTRHNSTSTQSISFNCLNFNGIDPNPNLNDCQLSRCVFFSWYSVTRRAVTVGTCVGVNERVYENQPVALHTSCFLLLTHLWYNNQNRCGFRSSVSQREGGTLVYQHVCVVNWGLWIHGCVMYGTVCWIMEDHD